PCVAASVVASCRLVRRRMLRSRNAAFRQPSHQIVTQDDGAVALHVVRAVEQRYGSFPGGIGYGLPGNDILVALLLVTLLEFGPALGAMPEPLAQRSAGCDVLAPLVQPECLLLPSAGPESLHENT